jgi:ATP-dependent 26S proteasome regulatory subunit
MFIDEIDAIGKSRGGVDTHGDKTLNQVLTLISDLDQSKDNIFIIGATNNFKALDKALIRSGRLSKHIEVKLPDLDGVRQIFDIHSAKKPLDKNIDKDALIKRLYDLRASGGDIRYVINEAHIIGYDRAGIHEKMENGTITSRDKQSFRILQEDFDKAIEKFKETRNGTEAKPIGFNKR